MKPYGVPKSSDRQSPDCLDIHTYAMKSSVGSIKSKSGEYRGIIKNKRKKRSTRRRFKRMARREGKALCMEES